MSQIKLLIFIILIINLLNIIICDKIKLYDNIENDWKEFQEFQEWKKLKDNFKRDKIISNVDYNNYKLPFKNYKKYWNHKKLLTCDNDTILMARFVVNQANWSSIATISTRNDIKSYPFANVISVSDGPLGDGSGIPYTYLTPLDFTSKDISKDYRATMMMTLAQGPWCKDKSMDPMDPRCARITLSGKVKKVLSGDEDYEIAKNAVFGRHPWLAKMPPDHHFYLAKLKIASIALLDAFGGPKFIDVKQYLAASNKSIFIDKTKQLSRYAYQV